MHIHRSLLERHLDAMDPLRIWLDGSSGRLGSVRILILLTKSVRNSVHGLKRDLLTHPVRDKHGHSSLSVGRRSADRVRRAIVR